MGAVTLTWIPPLPLRPDTLFVRIVAAPVGATTAVRNLIITSMGLGSGLVPIPDAVAPGPGPASAQVNGPNGKLALQLAGAALSAGFELRGDLMLAWTGVQPTGSRLAMQIKVGHVAVDAPDAVQRRRRMKTYGPELIVLADLVAGKRRLGAYGYGDDDDGPTPEVRP